MPIDVNAPNFLGPAYLARVRDGSLNLENQGATLTGAIQASNDTQKNNISRMAVQQQGQLGLLSNSLDEQKLQQNQQAMQQQLPLEQQKNAMAQQQVNQQGLFQQGQLANEQQSTAQTGAYQQGQLANAQQSIAQQGAYQQGQLANDQANTAATVQKNQLAALTAQSQEKIKEQGAFASYTRLAMQQAQTPDQQRQIQTQAIQQAVDKGYMSKDDAAQAMQLPIPQFNALTESHIINTGMASDFKSQVEANKASGASGASVTLPDGTQAVPLTPTEKSAVQKDLITAQGSLKQFQKMNSGVQDNWFGQAANWSGPEMTKWQLNKAGIPGVGSLIPNPSDADKADLQSYSNYNSNAYEQVFSTVRALTGNRINQKEFDATAKNIVPMVGPDATRPEFNGKMQQVQNALQSLITQKQQLLDRGIKLSPAAEDAMVSQALQGGASAGNSKDPLPGESRDAYIARMNQAQGGQQ